MPPLAITRPKMLPSPLGDGVGHSNHDRFRGYLSVHLRSGLQFPCLRFATAVTGRHARLGTRLLARLCRGCHFRRLCLTSFQGATPTDPDVRVLPHPAPRQTASLRAVAYPLVQEARRWPPPSLRLVWPVRLSVVVTWRRDPTSVGWPSFPPTVPPAGAPFPPRGLVGSIPPLRRYYETLRLFAAHPPALRCGVVALIGTSPHRSRSAAPSPIDAVRHWPAKPSHLIHDVARENDLSPPPCRTARSKAVSDDRLVPEERVLHAGLPMVA